MDITSPSLFMRAATSPSYVKGGARSQGITLRMGGSASIVQKLAAQQECLMDAQSLLFVLEDDFRQLDMLAPSLGLSASIGAKKASDAAGRSRPSTQRSSLGSAGSLKRGSATAASLQSSVQTLVIPRSRSRDSTVSNRTHSESKPTRQADTSRRTSTTSAAASPGTRTSSASTGPTSRRSSGGAQGLAVVVTGSQPSSPPAYSSRRTSGPPDYATVVDVGAPAFPLGAFDPDAQTFNASFNASIRVHPKSETSAMPRRTSIAVDLLCPKTEEIPIQDVAVAAQRFAYAHRNKVNQMAARTDMAHEWLVGALSLTCDEQGARERLSTLLVAIEEETARYAVYGEYDKFVVFCMENEPVWRRAARTLQQRKDERLNSTENTFARFALIDSALQQKSREYQEYMDFMVSLKMVEHDELQVALHRARQRRRVSTMSNRAAHTPASAGLHAEEGAARPRATSNSTPLTRALRRPPAAPTGSQNRTQSNATSSKGSSQVQPAPPAGPNPNRPTPRRMSNGSTSTSGSADRLAAATGSSSAGTSYARIRADRVAPPAQLPSPSRTAAPAVGILSATEAEPRFIAPNRPLPADHWMEVQRVPNR